MVSNVKEYSGRAIEIEAEIKSEATSESSKAISTTNLRVIFFTGGKLYFGNSLSVQIYINLIEV